LTRFAAAFPGEILGISSSDIDGWLRGLNLATKSRNGMLICVKVLFSFARSQTCPPANDGNSPSITFKHDRELATDEEAAA
jgi:hypothetical protein